MLSVAWAIWWSMENRPAGGREVGEFPAVVAVILPEDAREGGIWVWDEERGGRRETWSHVGIGTEGELTRYGVQEATFRGAKGIRPVDALPAPVTIDSVVWASVVEGRRRVRVVISSRIGADMLSIRLPDEGGHIVEVNGEEFRGELGEVEIWRRRTGVDADTVVVELGRCTPLVLWMNEHLFIGKRPINWRQSAFERAISESGRFRVIGQRRLDPVSALPNCCPN